MAGRVARKRALGRPQFGDLKFLMIGSKDGINGVGNHHSSFVPSQHSTKRTWITGT
jgi:hypothetical protein